MSFEAAAFIACLVTIAAGLAATHPEELRPFRWLKIALSLPIVVLVVSVFHELGPIRGYFAMFGIGVLGFIWKSPIAHFLSFGFTRLIVGDWQRPTGVRCELAGPRALFKRGDLPDALRLLLQELDKDPFNYEGLLLLADLHEAMDRPTEAAKPLEKLLNKPGLSADQTSMVSARLRTIQDRLLVAALNQR